MANTVAVVGSTFSFGVAVYAAGTANFQANPTIAAGDFRISTNGGAFENPDNLPAVGPGTDVRIGITISAAETTAAGAGGEIWLCWIDAAGAEWDDGFVIIRVAATNQDSLATAAALATVDTNVDSVLEDTGTTLPATLATTDGKIDTVDANVDAILTDTGTAGVVLADDAITAAKITAAAEQEIADEILKRGVSNVENAADAHSLACIVLAVLESSLSGATWTIKKTGGTTFTTKTVTTDASADPITGVT